MKNAFRMLVCLLLCLALTGAAGAQEKARGFDTQEACANALVEALRSGDAEAFLNCYAIEETARNFNLTASVERIGALLLHNSLLEPSNDWSVALNKAKLTNDLLRALTNAGIVLSNAEAEPLIVNPRLITKKEYTPEQMVALAKMGDALSRLEYQGMIDPADLVPPYAKVFEKQGYQFELYGMKAWQEKVLTLKLDGRTVYMALGFVRYDGGWLLKPTPGSVIGMIAGAPPQLLLVFEDLIRRK